jgi:hypothetical protein
MDQNENPPSRWTTDPGAIPGEPYDYLDIPMGEPRDVAVIQFGDGAANN